MITTYFLYTLLFLIVKFVWDRRNLIYLASKLNGVQGIYGIPLIGVAFKFMFTNEKKFFDMVSSYAFEFNFPNKVWIGPLLMFTITEPETAKIVLNASECLNKPNFFDCFRLKYSSLFGTSLDAWKSHRKILLPLLTSQKIKKFIPIFNEKSKRLLDDVKRECGTEEFNICPYSAAFFLEVSLSTFFDYDYDILKCDKRSEYINYFEQ